MEHAFEVSHLGDKPDEEDLAMLAAPTVTVVLVQRRPRRRSPGGARAGHLREATARWTLAVALRKGRRTFSLGHLEESFALMKHALDFSLEHDLEADAATSYFILSDRCFRADRYTEALEYLDKSLALARKQGSRPVEWGRSPSDLPAPHARPLGRVVERLTLHTGAGRLRGVVLSVLQQASRCTSSAANFDAPNRIFSLYARLETSTDVQDRETYLSAAALSAALRAASRRRLPPASRR